jgi:hypothetical protein
MHVAVRLRHDFTITEAQELLALARAAYVERNSGSTERDAEEAVRAVADVMFTILEHDGLLGDAADPNWHCIPGTDCGSAGGARR